MIHYYFRDKEGLYRAMLESAVAPVIARVSAMLGDPAAVDRLRNAKRSNQAAPRTGSHKWA